ncbi:MAG: hypothetical protein ABMB14_19880 [Myxococcota bacterium]
MRALRWLWVWVVASMVGPAAQAAPVITTFCFEFNIAYTDGAVGDLLTGTSTTARGNRVQFVKESNNTVVADVYTDPTSGCVTLTGVQRLDTSFTYTIRLPREASIGGNTIVVQNASGGSITAVPKTGLTPAAFRTYSYANGDFWTRLSATDPAMIVAAAEWSLNRRTAGLSGETFVFRNAGCGGSGTDSCFDQATELLWIGAPTRKFAIAHVMGLAVANFANGHADALRDDNAALGACVPGATQSGHAMNTKEFSSEAAYEGFGSFYAAAAFNNDGTDADCEFSTGTKVDWSANGLMNEPDEDTVFSCSASPAPNQSPAINDFDYFDQKCFSGDINNRSTRYDWLKMLWDYRTDSVYGGYTVEDVYDRWDAANPDTWNANGNAAGGTNGYPYKRLLDADGGNILGDWSLLGSGRHGIHH